MKLRLHQNSARLRLDQNDVARLQAKGRVEGETRFGPASRLTYAVEVVPQVEEVSVRLEADGFVVLVPEALAQEWIETDRVGFACEHSAGEGASLRVVVEKDFACLHGDAPPDPTAFPHPDAPASSARH